MVGLIVALGLVNWLATLIVVESEFFRGLRDWVRKRERKALHVGDGAKGEMELAWRRIAALFDVPPGLILPSRKARAWGKARYLLACHLCTGAWIGLVLAALVPAANPFGAGLVGLILTGLLIKAGGHVTLEVTALLKRALP